MALPVKHSVAVLICSEGRLLAIRRPENDDELPGIWGLPAGTCRKNETIEDVVRRVGKEKLGVVLHPLRKIASGQQDRPTYKLLMELWEAAMEGTPSYPEWRWAGVDLLKPGATQGSLCCALAIQNEGRVSG